MSLEVIAEGTLVLKTQTAVLMPEAVAAGVVEPPYDEYLTVRKAIRLGNGVVLVYFEEIVNPVNPITGVEWGYNLECFRVTMGSMPQGIKHLLYSLLSVNA